MNTLVPYLTAAFSDTSPNPLPQWNETAVAQGLPACLRIPLNFTSLFYPVKDRSVHPPTTTITPNTPTRLIIGFLTAHALVPARAHSHSHIHIQLRVHAYACGSLKETVHPTPTPKSDVLNTDVLLCAITAYRNRLKNRKQQHGLYQMKSKKKYPFDSGMHFKHLSNSTHVPKRATEGFQYSIIFFYYYM